MGDKHLIHFKDGSEAYHHVYLYSGAAMIGDPTAYIYKNKEMVWVRPSCGYHCWYEA